MSDYPSLVTSWIAQTIPELEAGIHNGTLAELLERPDVQEVLGPVVLERYRVIAAEKVQHDPVFRRNWVLKFIEIFQQSLQPPHKQIPAKALHPWSFKDPTPPPLVATHYQGNTIVRPDQVLSARRWGFWFTFSDEQLGGFYLSFLVSKSLQALASHIKNLWNLEATYLSRHSGLRPNAEWSPEQLGGQFEHMMMDVLNETAPIARAAPLAEDILERTDLRIKLPTIKRENGARVQVSLKSDPKFHDRKVKAMCLPDEFVILTPLELARCAVHPPTSPQFADFSWTAFWSSLGGPSRDVHALAQELHRLFIDALSFPVAHPLGPMWFLSPPLRQFIRSFTEHHAVKTTNCVRQRLEKSPHVVNSVRKYTGGFWKARLSLPQKPHPNHDPKP